LTPTQQEPGQPAASYAYACAARKLLPMRKYIALAVGLAMIGGGLWWAGLLIDAISFPIWMAIGSAFFVFLGVHLAWVTLREWRQAR
jgi:hypothetical protein